ncbi:helix-turn-helix transcriptional regulator [Nannocystis radixulma]|uniref:AraC family transcriptional regulator n=1 Tax=Nannocystis radixulma TaxID=2995305 RepID=A0ABT5AWP5_9BACT|nr:AraC family transcriptional regulator [Nannocystis radixulma]MDC0666268.1 AraC family transcriptional regulator [Nannocystis radixulma]
MPLKPDLFRRLCRARDLLREVPVDPVTIADIADEVDLSPFHFSRQFEAVFGRTPHQYRIESRLERARHLLAGGHHSVTEVCMEVGFSSLGSFSALFTRRIGATPSAYQRRLRGLVQVPGALPRQLLPGCFWLMGGLPPGALRSFREA